MDLFEYQAKALFAKHDVPTTPGRVADTAEEAEKVAPRSASLSSSRRRSRSVAVARPAA